MQKHPRVNLRKACLCVLLAQALPCLPDSFAETPAVLEGPVTVSPRAGLEPLPAGVVLNGRPLGDLVLYKADNDYWIPYSLFISETGLREVPGQGTTASFATSVGTLSFDKAELKTIENAPYISFASLKKAFLVRAVFDMKQYAALLDAPWGAARQLAGTSKSGPPVPDVSAPAGSLSFLSVDTGMQADFHGGTSTTLNLQAGGRVAGGVWDLDYDGDPSKEMALQRYHWTTYTNNFAMRLGTGTNLLSPESLNNDFTGVQFGWNNRKILDYLDTSGLSATDIFVSLNRNQYRTIEGNGPVAGIAELRFDGRIVARMRIRLDGRFFFENVRMGADLRKTEVYIYERSPMDKPVAILDYTQSVINGSLPAGELLVRGGAGRSGNPLNRSEDEVSPPVGTGYVQVQYGLGNRLTLDAGAQYNPASSNLEYSTGTILSLGSNWAASFYGTQSNRHYGTDLRVEGHGRTWDLTYLSQWNERDFSFDGLQQQTQQWFRFSKMPLERLTLLFYGRRTSEENVETKSFLLPGLYAAPFSNLRFAAIPNENGHYRYELDKTFSPTSEMRLIHEMGVASAEWNTRLMSNMNARLLYEYAFDTRNSLVGGYLDWYPKNSRFDFFELGVSHSGKEYGYTGKWIKYLNAGLKIALQYSWNMSLAQNLVTTNEYSEFIMPPLSRHFFACTLNWDLGFSGLRPFPINRSAITTTRGGLAGRIAIEGETDLSASDINDVGILLNGRRLDQRQIDGSFFVGYLRPGFYQVTVDTENLPIELAVEKKKLLVEVRNGSVTNVNIAVRAMYGIDGRVVDGKGNGVGEVELEVIGANGSVAATTTTNEFGDYRTDGIPPGAYRLKIVSISGQRVETLSAKEVVVKGDYLSGVELGVGDLPAAKKPADAEGAKAQ
jgi:hypothetical protein